MFNALCEFMGLVVGKQLSDKPTIEGTQIVEEAVARTQIDHVEEGPLRRGYADVVVEGDAVHASPKLRINLAKRIGKAINVHCPREIAHRRDGVIVLEHHSGTLQHILQRHIGGVKQTARHLFLPIVAFGINALARVLKQSLSDVTVQLGYNSSSTLAIAHHGQKLCGEYRPAAIQYV